MCVVEETAVLALAAVAVFKALGGRFRGVVPSCLHSPGAFGHLKATLPASGPDYATKAQREQLQQLGRRFGCHTCGRRLFAEFVGDHMPPNNRVRPGQAQRFYPQCVRCSNQQGGTIRSGNLELRTHWRSIRLSHAWLPLGPLLVAALAPETLSSASSAQSPSSSSSSSSTTSWREWLPSFSPSPQQNPPPSTTNNSSSGSSSAAKAAEARAASSMPPSDAFEGGDAPDQQVQHAVQPRSQSWGTVAVVAAVVAVAYLQSSGRLF